MYYDPLKEVRGIISKTVSDIESSRRIAMRPLIQANQNLSNTLEINRVFKYSLLKTGFVNVMSLKSSELTKINLPFNDLLTNFKSNLFSESTLNNFKSMNNLNSKIIDESINVLRYQYVINSFHTTKFKFMIEWDPVISVPVNNLKHIADVYTDNVESNSDVVNNIHEVTPFVSSFAMGVLTSNVSDSITPAIEYLALEFLPFVPDEIRVLCFWVIVLLVALKKLEQ